MVYSTQNCKWCLSERIHFPVVKINKMLSSGDGVCLKLSTMALHLTWHPSEAALQYSLKQREAVLTPGNRMVYLSNEIV